MLQWHSYIEIKFHRSISLIFHFRCDFVPIISVFFAMIASLVTKVDTFKWILQERCRYHSQNNHFLCKNKATFRINATNNVTLISRAKQYEVYITCISTTVTDKTTLVEVCSHLETVWDSWPSDLQDEVQTVSDFSLLIKMSMSLVLNAQSIQMVIAWSLTGQRKGDQKFCHFLQSLSGLITMKASQ